MTVQCSGQTNVPASSPKLTLGGDSTLALSIADEQYVPAGSLFAQRIAQNACVADEADCHARRTCPPLRPTLREHGPAGKIVNPWLRCGRPTGAGTDGCTARTAV